MPPPTTGTGDDELTAFVTQPPFVFAYAWQPNDLICWVDSCIMHRAWAVDSTRHMRLERGCRGGATAGAGMRHTVPQLAHGAAPDEEIC